MPGYAVGTTPYTGYEVSAGTYQQRTYFTDPHRTYEVGPVGRGYEVGAPRTRGIVATVRRAATSELGKMVIGGAAAIGLSYLLVRMIRL